jgi:hypothetical protein
MIKRNVWCMVAAMALAAANAGAGGMEPQPYKGSKEFERMKTLAGVWEGTDMSNPTGQPVRVEYRVTGAGSAVVETLFPGTPHEMVTIYHDKAGALCMTHYCALGNRPHMTLKGSTADTIELELAPGGEVAAKEPHMHALKITFEGPDKIVHTWTRFADGQKEGVSTFKFTRVK